MGKLHRRTIEPPAPTSVYDLINVAGDETCFVCEKAFKKGGRKIFIGNSEKGRLYRHDDCNALSEIYIKKFTNVLNHKL